MTPNPIVVAPFDTLASVREVMRAHRLHHVPVMDAGALVGILSDRDLAMMNPFGDRVRDAMTTDVVSVSLETGIDEVATVMEARRFGSVVVLDAERVAGIFTLHDALRALRDVIQRVDASER